jgi:hypothetical protein
VTRKRTNKQLNSHEVPEPRIRRTCDGNREETLSWHETRLDRGRDGVSFGSDRNQYEKDENSLYFNAKKIEVIGRSNVEFIFTEIFQTIKFKKYLTTLG